MIFIATTKKLTRKCLPISSSFVILIFCLTGCFWRRWLLFGLTKSAPKKLKSSFFLRQGLFFKGSSTYFTVLIYVATRRDAKRIFTHFTSINLPWCSQSITSLMYVYYTDPHFFYECLITVVIALLHTSALLPPAKKKKKICIAGDDQRCISASSSFKTGITNMLLASYNVWNIKIWLHQQFSTYWKDNNIPNIKKQTKQTRFDGYDRLRWISLSLLGKSVCCYFN